MGASHCHCSDTSVGGLVTSRPSLKTDLQTRNQAVVSLSARYKDAMRRARLRGPQTTQDGQSFQLERTLQQSRASGVWYTSHSEWNNEYRPPTGRTLVEKRICLSRLTCYHSGPELRTGCYLENEESFGESHEARYGSTCAAGQVMSLSRVGDCTRPRTVLDCESLTRPKAQRLRIIVVKRPRAPLFVAEKRVD